jgi:hypothetical protein
MSSNIPDIVDQISAVMAHVNLAKTGAQIAHHIRKDHVPIDKHPEKKKIEQENLKKWGFSIVF